MALGFARWFEGEHGAERLDLVVGIFRISARHSHTAKPGRTGAPDGSRQRPEERRRALGCEEAALRGTEAGRCAQSWRMKRCASS
jgi:hypothetical protein